MIDRASIMAWAEHAPWTDPAMVEQDLWGLQHQSSTSPTAVFTPVRREGMKKVKSA